MDIGQSVQRSFDKLFDFLLHLLCLVLLLVGFIVAKVLQGPVRTLLKHEISRVSGVKRRQPLRGQCLAGLSAASGIAQIGVLAGG